MILFSFVLLCLSHWVYSQQQNDLPIVVPSRVLPSSGLTCPQLNHIDQSETVRQHLQDHYLSTFRPPCSCGATGGWTRAVYLDMSDPNQQCPPGWTIATSPVRGCGRNTSGAGDCDSVTYPVGRTYSNVCGRVAAIQKGWAGAFHNMFGLNLTDIEYAYLDGVSLTHGARGSRQHIWSFVGAYYEQNPDYATIVNCPCTNTNLTWPHQLPSFINNNYFCETGNPGPTASMSAYYTDDPLWDGQGCGSSSSCCQFNTPPWFCTTLPQATSDDLELRNCYGDASDSEDKLITFMDIYVS